MLLNVLKVGVSRPRYHFRSTEPELWMYTEPNSKAQNRNSDLSGKVS